MKRMILAGLTALLLVLSAACGAANQGQDNQAQPPEAQAPADTPSGETSASSNDSKLDHSDVPALAHAVVNGAFTGEDGTEIAGKPTYRTVQEAINWAPYGEAYVIYIKNGTYYEKLTIPHDKVTLVGQDRDQTILTFDAASGKIDPATGKNYGTSGSASITVEGSEFRAENLTISNSFDYMGNKAKADSDPTKVKDAQAVALKTTRNSDKAIFYNVKLLGHQDTLYADRGTHYFKNSYIAGSVDFIFGGGQAVFDNCEIVSLDRGDKSNNGFITAASTEAEQKFGYLFINSKLLKEKPEMADHTVALGRPWKATAHVVYLNTYMDSHISAKGWESMSENKPENAKFYEFGSTGPGAVKSETRRMLSEAEAAGYSIADVLGGWDTSAVEPLK